MPCLLGLGTNAIPMRLGDEEKTTIVDQTLSPTPRTDSVKPATRLTTRASWRKLVLGGS